MHDDGSIYCLIIFNIFTSQFPVIVQLQYILTTAPGTNKTSTSLLTSAYREYLIIITLLVTVHGLITLTISQAVSIIKSVYVSTA